MLLSLFQQDPVRVLTGSPQTGARLRTSTHQLLYTINTCLYTNLLEILTPQAGIAKIAWCLVFQPLRAAIHHVPDASWYPVCRVCRAPIHLHLFLRVPQVIAASTSWLSSRWRCHCHWRSGLSHSKATATWIHYGYGSRSYSHVRQAQELSIACVSMSARNNMD